MDGQNLEEVKFMITQLQLVLGNDNAARKEAEKHIDQIKVGEPDKYAAYLTVIITQDDCPVNIKTLCAVLLRRSVNTVVADKKETLWELIKPDTRELVKTKLLEDIKKGGKDKSMMHKLANLLVEVQGAMHDLNEDDIWQDLLNTIFGFVNSQNNTEVDAALQLFNGLFSYIIDHLNKHKDELKNIFRQTLNHSDVDVKIAALQAVSNYLQTVEPADTKPFQELIGDMCQVIISSDQADDETNLQDALIEFNEIAEIEPKFFQSKFKDIFQAIKYIVSKKDFANDQIRQQPLEFFVTVVERVPSIAKKDNQFLQDLIGLVFELMFDIEDEIDESWLQPKEGYRESAEGDDGEDNVNFGKGCIDKIISAIGDTLCLPLLSQAVQNCMAGDDWKKKNAALMAFSQVGEYIEDVETISAMVPVVLALLNHQNPRVRYAALHCIGQISDDMTEDFQERYGSDVLPELLRVLDDPVPRVSAHCCSAITNFMDGASEELVKQNFEAISTKLMNLLKTGISIQKENAVTAFATTVVVIKTDFDPYFSETTQNLLSCLNLNQGAQYRQLRAQIIEAITLIGSSVSPAVFKTESAAIIQSMMLIQSSQMDPNDPQRSYLLTAWQRVCLILKTEFTPFLQQILPSILQMATLKPTIGVEGQEGTADLGDVLQDMQENDKKKATVITDEVEEKDSAIQMLIVFIEELGAGFAQYADQVSEILLNHTQYYGSENIRTTCAGALPSLMKCAKEANVPTSVIHDMAKKYSNNILDAMDVETENETMVSQVQGIKEILEEAGADLLQAESVTLFTDKVLKFIEESENRLKENTSYEKENLEGDEEDRLDEEDLIVLKEENKNENELQLALAELLGMMFKYHKAHCANLVQRLINEILPEVAKDTSKAKVKFLLFILDDMVEFLGPDFLGPLYPKIVEQICSHTNSKYSAVRQAAVYGIGMTAQHGGTAFSAISMGCLQAIQTAVQFPLDDVTKGKKSKLTQYYHARDNAVAALGRVLRYQGGTIDQSLNLPGIWIDLMPLTHDMEEATEQNDFLAYCMLKDPMAILGANYEKLEKFIMVIGEICCKKAQCNPETWEKMAVVIANVFTNPAISAQVQQLCTEKLTEQQRGKLQEVYATCNEEVRAKVAATVQ